MFHTLPALVGNASVTSSANGRQTISARFRRPAFRSETLPAVFGYLNLYGGELEGLCFPSDDKSGVPYAPYPYYDRWGDSWNVNAEMVVLNQARGLGTLAFLAAQARSRATVETYRRPNQRTCNCRAGGFTRDTHHASAWHGPEWRARYLGSARTRTCLRFHLHHHAPEQWIAVGGSGSPMA